MSKRKRKPAQPENCRDMGSRGRCICCWTPYELDPHHRQPKSQNGALDETNEVMACRGCHSLYHEICGQGLAKTAQDRVKNLVAWMRKFQDAPKDFFGAKGGQNPGKMAPDFVQEELGHWMLSGRYRDYSKGCLSRLGKIKHVKQREFG